MLEYSPGLILTIWALAIALFNADPVDISAPFLITESAAVIGYILVTKRKLG